MKPTLLASYVLKLEAFFVLGISVYLIALGFTHDKSWMPYLSVIGFALAGSAGLFALARGIKDRKRWSYSPGILANLIALGVAKYQYEAGLFWLAVPISVMALIVISCLAISFAKQGK